MYNDTLMNDTNCTAPTSGQSRGEQFLVTVVHIAGTLGNSVAIVVLRKFGRSRSKIPRILFLAMTTVQLTALLLSVILVYIIIYFPATNKSPTMCGFQHLWRNFAVISAFLCAMLTTDRSFAMRNLHFYRKHFMESRVKYVVGFIMIGVTVLGMMPYFGVGVFYNAMYDNACLPYYYAEDKTDRTYAYFVLALSVTMIVWILVTNMYNIYRMYSMRRTVPTPTILVSPNRHSQNDTDSASHSEQRATSTTTLTTTLGNSERTVTASTTTTNNGLLSASNVLPPPCEGDSNKNVTVQSGTPASHGNTRRPTPTVNQHRVSEARLREEVEFAKLVAMVTMVFTFFWTPTLVQAIGTLEHIWESRFVDRITDVVMMINYVITPYIILSYRKRYRRGVRKAVVLIFCFCYMPRDFEQTEVSNTGTGIYSINSVWRMNMQPADQRNRNHTAAETSVVNN